MTYEAARAVIQQYFNANWTGTPMSAVVLDNEPQPTKPAGSWVRLSINPNFSQQESFGGGTDRFRRFGIVFVQIFTRQGIGPKVSDALIDETVNLFEVIVGGPSKRRLAGPPSILFGDVNVTRVGRTEDEFYQQNVAAFFQFDDLK
jgi:hypothetical protein